MKTRAVLPLFLLSFLVVPLVHAEPARYWFQVGAFVADGEATHLTGASVEINVHSEQPQDASLSYWVGLPLGNNVFIQVGYLIDAGSARSFWAYFTRTNKYIEHDDSYLAPGWTNFSIVSSNTEWAAYVSSESIGKVNLNATDSGYNVPYAIAENPQVPEPAAILGPVEFRNLQYRTSDTIWHLARIGEAYVGYAAGSAILPDGTQYPYGISFQPGRDNYWIAGSLSSSVKDKQILWPWHQVQVDSAAGFTVADPSGWYTYNTTTLTVAVPTIRETGRGQLVFWYWSMSNRETLLSATKGLNQTAQFKLNSSITVSAIYRLRNFR